MGTSIKSSFCVLFIALVSVLFVNIFNDEIDCFVNGDRLEAKWIAFQYKRSIDRYHWQIPYATLDIDGVGTREIQVEGPDHAAKSFVYVSKDRKTLIPETRHGEAIHSIAMKFLIFPLLIGVVLIACLPRKSSVGKLDYGKLTFVEKVLFFIPGSSLILLSLSAICLDEALANYEFSNYGFFGLFIFGDLLFLSLFSLVVLAAILELRKRILVNA
jgi:hypothetical protein